MITLETMLKLTYGDNSQEQMSVRDALNYILKSLSMDCKTVCGIIEELSEGIELHELDIKVLEFGNTTTSAIVKRVVQVLEDALREDVRSRNIQYNREDLKDASNTETNNAGAVSGR